MADLHVDFLGKRLAGPVIAASGTLWKKALCKLGAKYEIWSRFPQIPTFN